MVIMGASSGIGLATAQKAAERGANVILVSRNGGALDAICEDIRSRGGRADYLVADVGVREEVRHVVDTVVSRHGGFDTWINNAGVGIYAPLMETSDEDHEKIFRTNYWGVVYGCTEALKHMRHRGGALISTGSIASDMPSPILGAYTATKHAVKGFVDSLRLELKHENSPVSVTLIQPSGIDSPFGRHARNYMDGASKVPPPVYSPYVVANAMLHAAEHRTRDLVVGGAGASLISLLRFWPRGADRVIEKMFFLTAVDRKRPPRESEALHRPGEGGRVVGDQQGYTLKSSAYTEAKKHPAAAWTIGLTTAAAVLLALQYRNGTAGRFRSYLNWTK